MLTVTVTRDASAGAYLAAADGKEAVGPTLGLALDALTAQLDPGAEPSLVIVRRAGGDRFFTDAQNRRLAALTTRARGNGTPISPAERAELDGLVQAEFAAAAARSAEIAERIGS